MQLTRYTDYGLRTLIYLALLPQGRRASIDEISTTYDISRNNVNKIVHQLGKAGIIETKRGKGGGFYLKKKPEELNIGDLVVLLENTLQVVECKTPQCRILPACKLKGILGQATQAFLDSLKAYTLANLLEDEANNLIQILNIQSD
ncbi:Rrf2 family transcriptional regulator [Paraglaciecola arctica]|uniref:Rrf2 family transcriptional regulator, nitric oxide-sensitive transcriptional repressor n=1 Tax=Paraglaciecola arctica BSs20135 TaxID=493475 RepID=K6YSI6_9ALTE|nr:Rrf2 family transcriptional regulator [Paraglaciecola arctica]GAC21137.1 Rrf2 family transcriptional regulator, nitric oxide-sensitive transcriptional repressor [Paraglaciecola arctica BSs20135]